MILEYITINPLTPAKAGVFVLGEVYRVCSEIPAFAGMSGEWGVSPLREYHMDYPYETGNDGLGECIPPFLPSRSPLSPFS